MRKNHLRPFMKNQAYRQSSPQFSDQEDRDVRKQNPNKHTLDSSEKFIDAETSQDDTLSLEKSSTQRYQHHNRRYDAKERWDKKNRRQQHRHRRPYQIERSAKEYNPVKQINQQSNKKSHYPLFEQSHEIEQVQRRKKQYSQSNSIRNISKLKEGNIQNKQLFLDVLQQIQLIDYRNSNQSSQTLRKQFVKIVSQHVDFDEEYYPFSKSQVGRMLIANGIFHDMWSKVIFKKVIFLQRERLLVRYYQKYRQGIEKGVSNFQKVFNPVPSDQDSMQYGEQAYKHYLQNYDDSTRVSSRRTKDHCILTFQQIKKEIERKKQNEKIQIMFAEDVRKKVEKYRIKSAQEQLLVGTSQMANKIDGISDDILSERSSVQDQPYVFLSNQQRNHSTPKNHQPQRSLDLLFQQCITNESRIMCQMACSFLQINKFYKLADIEIIQIKQTLFSDKQQIAVVRAYTAEFEPEVGQMRIDPKIKTLIAVYRFANLIELNRLQKTYGKFDGVIIYSQFLNLKTFLQSLNCHTFIKAQYLKELMKQKVEQEMNSEAVAIIEESY